MNIRRESVEIGLCLDGVARLWGGGDAEIDGLAVGAPVDLGELVVGPGEADLESFDFAGQPSRSASLIRAIRLSRISAMRGRWAAPGQSIGQRMQA